MKTNLLDFSLTELKELLTNYGEKAYRAEQLYFALNLGLDFTEMTNIPNSLKEKLSENYYATPLKIIKTLKSVDGTEKYLYKLNDGNVVEGVLMSYKYGKTLCVSTQVGCRMGCAFCASGLNGLVRNLSCGEILGQVVMVNRLVGGKLGDKRKVINVVLMGSGEPLDNYENTVKFIKLLADEKGLNISPRNVSLSTSGIVPKIYELADLKLPVNLTISLHAPFDDERKEIMPIAKSYSIKNLLDSASYYFEKTKRRYIFEYVLIYGKNDTNKHAEELIRLLKGRPCHVNLIRLNEVKEKNLIATEDKMAYRFLGVLEKAGISATLRRRMGVDIDGACGQLRQRFLEEGENI